MLIDKQFNGATCPPDKNRARITDGQRCQEFICGADGRNSTLDNAMSECGAFGLQPREAAHEVATVIEVVDTWRTHFAQNGVTASDIEHLAAFIDGDVLLVQRRGFDPKRYTWAGGKCARRARRGPFSGKPRCSPRQHHPHGHHGP